MTRLFSVYVVEAYRICSHISWSYFVVISLIINSQCLVAKREIPIPFRPVQDDF